MALPPPYKTSIFLLKTRYEGLQTGLFRGGLIFMRGGSGEGGILGGILGSFWGYLGHTGGACWGATCYSSLITPMTRATDLMVG